MSEKLHTSKHEHLQQHNSVERAKEHLEKLRKTAEADAEKHATGEHLKEAESAVEELAISASEMAPAEPNKETSPSAGYVNRELKDMAFKRSLNTARRHMNAPAKLMSKVIHQPIVEKVSEIAAETIARPSGLLGGGLFAVIGSSLLLWITKHYGYTYNYLAFVMLFVAGFAIGMIVELVLRMLIRQRKR